MGLALYVEAQEDCLIMSELSLERTLQDPRMQGQSPFWVVGSVSCMKGKTNKRFVSNVWKHAPSDKLISFKVGLVLGPPWHHGKLIF
jgi:hypothetical protein